MVTLNRSADGRLSWALFSMPIDVAICTNSELAAVGWGMWESLGLKRVFKQNMYTRGPLDSFASQTIFVTWLFSAKGH